MNFTLKKLLAFASWSHSLIFSSHKQSILTRDVILPWFHAVLECGHIGLGEDFSFDLRLLFRARIGW